jgi:ABC-type transport system involved in cytochrome bd biosynthesis fused ATPase/permease subunit
VSKVPAPRGRSARLGGHFPDVVEGLPTLKLFGRANPQAEVIGRVTGEYRKATMSSLRVAFLSGFVLELAAALATAVVAVEVGLRLLAGHMSYSTALLVLLLTPEAYLPLRAVGAQFHARRRQIGWVPQHPHLFAATVAENIALGDPAASREAIAAAARAVGADGFIETLPRRLRHRSRGARAAAGKSTVAAVLFRFAGLSAGTARLNGRDLAGYDPDDVRAAISGCSAGPHIFDATIRDNLRLARPDAGDAELAAAAGRARLLAWIGSLPGGWDTPVGTHGTALSGGQRQRLALARALLADPALLVLDEPTAHLDQENRRALTADLRAATAGRATLLITHDLDGLDQVDEIVVLDHGRVAERGPHHQLIEAGGVYHRLWQAGRYADDRP